MTIAVDLGRKATKTNKTLALKQATLTGIVPVRPFPVLSRYQTHNCYFPCS